MMNAFVENVKRKIKLPAPTNKAKKSRKPKKKNPADTEALEPGVVYVGHIPHGFYEKEMRAYFSQFGGIRRLRLARSSKTGGSKGFAYIEFESKEVAKIVAETMNNYLFFEKRLECEYKPSNEVDPRAFDGWDRRMPLRSERNRRKQNALKSDEQIQMSKEKRFKRLQKLRSSLRKSGINFKIKPFKPED